MLPKLSTNRHISRFPSTPPNPDSILREATIRQRQKWLQVTTDGLGLEGSHGATLERINAQGSRKSGVPLTDGIQSPNMRMPATPPKSHTIPSRYFLAGSPLPSTITPPIDDLEKEITIAVMGPGGNTHGCPKSAMYCLRQLLDAGKSYFIREVTGISEIKVSNSIFSGKVVSC